VSAAPAVSAGSSTGGRDRPGVLGVGPLVHDRLERQQADEHGGARQAGGQPPRLRALRLGGQRHGQRPARRARDGDRLDEQRRRRRGPDALVEGGHQRGGVDPDGGSDRPDVPAGVDGVAGRAEPVVLEVAQDRDPDAGAGADLLEGEPGGLATRPQSTTHRLARREVQDVPVHPRVPVQHRPTSSAVTPGA
jgi:hypothetical protein